MSSQQGIDMSRSGWENPEGLQRAPRQNVAPPPAPDVCEAPGPDGWTCDKPPGHRPLGEHWADTGAPGGLRWETAMMETTGPAEMNRGEQSFAPGAIIEPTPAGVLAEIRSLAESAMKAESPARWVIALDKIREVCVHEQSR